MNETIEIKLSNYQIEKATARLLHQHGVVRRLAADNICFEEHFECQLLESMQSRLAKLLVAHESLLMEQGRAYEMSGRRTAKAYWLYDLPSLKPWQE